MIDDDKVTHTESPPRAVSTIPLNNAESPRVILDTCLSMPVTVAYFPDRAQNRFCGTSPFVVALTLRNMLSMMETDRGEQNVKAGFPHFTKRFLKEAYNNVLNIDHFDADTMRRTADLQNGQRAAWPHRTMKHELEDVLSKAPLAYDVSSPEKLCVPLSLNIDAFCVAQVERNKADLLELAADFEERWGWKAEDLLVDVDVLRNTRRMAGLSHRVFSVETYIGDAETPIETKWFTSQKSAIDYANKRAAQERKRNGDVEVVGPSDIKKDDSGAVKVPQMFYYSTAPTPQYDLKVETWIRKTPTKREHTRKREQERAAKRQRVPDSRPPDDVPELGSTLELVLDD